MPYPRQKDKKRENEWKREMKKWWLNRQEEHRKKHKDSKDKRKDTRTKDEKKPTRPYPFLDCKSNFGPQLNNNTVTFPVWNDGNAPSWNCFVEVYEGPGGYSHSLHDYQLRGRTVITLQPGELKEVTVPWSKQQASGRIVGICYDPILDPKNFALVEQYNRHITSVHY